MGEAPVQEPDGVSSQHAPLETPSSVSSQQALLDTHTSRSESVAEIAPLAQGSTVVCSELANTWPLSNAAVDDIEGSGVASIPSDVSGGSGLSSPRDTEYLVTGPKAGARRKRTRL